MYKKATAIDVAEGNTILMGGYRCKATNVRHYFDNGEKYARYELTSNPNPYHAAALPSGFEGMTSGGNASVEIWIEEAGLHSDEFTHEMQPYGPTILGNATWIEYDNRPGLGRVTGRVIGGYEISRLFNHTNRTERQIGVEKTFDWIKREEFEKGFCVRVAM